MKRWNDYIKRTALINEQREECIKKVEYYKLWSTQTEKFTNWSRPEYFENRLEQERCARTKEEKKSKLAERRQRLAELLHAETLQHDRELQTLRRRRDDVEDLRRRHHELREKQDADLKAEAELQLYHQWRRDEPAVREAESEYRRGFVRQAWSQQMASKLASEAAARAEAERQWEERRLAALQETEAQEKADQQRREEERRAARFNAEEAAAKLESNRKASEELLGQEMSASRLEQELSRVDQDRLNLEKQRERVQYRSYLERQVVFRLQQQAKQAQRELEEDRALLQRVHEATEREAQVLQAQQKERRALADTLRAMVHQAKQESALAKHNANIFEEEARLELRVLEQRWEKERESRRRLLASVLAERQTQAREIRERAERQRQRLLQENEELRVVAEQGRLVQQAAGEMRAEEQRCCRVELENQMAEKQLQRRAEQERMRREEEERRQQASQEAAKLDQELKKIRLGRQRVAWL